MKNLEAAQVKMEEKLSSLTSFIDQELEKEKDSPVSLYLPSIAFSALLLSVLSGMESAKKVLI